MATEVRLWCFLGWWLLVQKYHKPTQEGLQVHLHLGGAGLR